MKVNAFLGTLANKSGLNLEDPKVKEFLALPALAEVEVPEELSKPVSAQLISITEAKNNHQDIRNHYIAQNFSAFDTEMDNLATEYTLTEDQKNAMKAERNSFKRVGILTKLIRDTEREKAKAGAPDKKAIQDQLDELNRQLGVEKQSLAALKTQHAKELLEQERKYDMDTLYSQFKTIHDELNPGIKRNILNSIVDDSLRGKGLKIEYDDNHNLVLLRNDGTHYHDPENNQKVDARGFIEKTLANSKQLKVQNANPPPGNNGNNNQPGNTGNNNQPAGAQGQKPKGNPVFNDIITETLEGLKQAELNNPVINFPQPKV
jgi:regulator of replication initiation timing